MLSTSEDTSSSHISVPTSVKQTYALVLHLEGGRFWIARTSDPEKYVFHVKHGSCPIMMHMYPYVGKYTSILLTDKSFADLVLEYEMEYGPDIVFSSFRKNRTIQSVGTLDSTHMNDTPLSPVNVYVFRNNLSYTVSYVDMRHSGTEYHLVHKFVVPSDLSEHVYNYLSLVYKSQTLE